MIRLATAADIRHLEAAIRASDRVAIDTEFHAERRYIPALFLVQLRLPNGEVWIVDPLKDQLLADLADALRSTRWILHGGQWDMEVLQLALGGLPEEILDTQIAAGLVRPWWPLGYANLVEDFLGIKLDKSVTLSDWSRRPLTEEQLTYAAGDVTSLFELWDVLEAELRAKDRFELALQACADARHRVVEPEAPEEAWKGIRGKSSLKGVQLAILQELATWRRERAIALNQPERSLLSDSTLHELAKRQPLTKASLTANRRMPRSLQKNADQVLEQIVRASKRPEWAWAPRGSTKIRRVAESCVARSLGHDPRVSRIICRDTCIAKTFARGCLPLGDPCRGPTTAFAVASCTCRGRSRRRTPGSHRSCAAR